MKRQGFTLVELLISMSILSIAVGMASLVFGIAIRQPKQLQPSIVSDSRAHSAIDNMIHDTKQSEAADYVKYSYSLRFGSINVNNVEGNFISYDGSEAKKDERNPWDRVRPQHKLFTFLGRKFDNTVVMANMKNLYFTNEDRFIYMPIISEDITLKVKYIAENNPQLKKVRNRFLKSAFQSRERDFIHGAYADNVHSYQEHPDLNTSEFLYIDEAIDSPENTFEGELTKTIKAYANDKQGYLDAIDRSYIAEGITLNKSGFSSAPLHTFKAFINSSDNRAAHIIGLPHIQNLIAHYDYNLVISKSTETEKENRNKYYSLYDTDMANKTIFKGVNAIVKFSGGKYHFDWGKSDVQSITSKNPQIGNITQIKLIPGFFSVIRLKHPEEPTTSGKDYPDVKKSHGNTANFDMGKSVVEIKIPKNKTYTVFTKFKLKPDSEFVPINLLNYNLDLENATLTDSRTLGFSIFFDSDGKLKLNKATDSGTFTTEDLGFDIKDTKLYSDGNFKFNTLSDGFAHERDGRENFNIAAITIKPYEEGGKSFADVQIHFLQKFEKSVSSSTYELNTKTKTIDEKVLISSNSNLSSDIKFELLGKIKKTAEATNTLVNSDKNGHIELSDLLFYSEDLSRKPYGSSNYLNLTMDYLYRKYLTEKERHEGGFDAFFMDKY